MLRSCGVFTLRMVVFRTEGIKNKAVASLSDEELSTNLITATRLYGENGGSKTSAKSSSVRIRPADEGEEPGIFVHALEKKDEGYPVVFENRHLLLTADILSHLSVRLSSLASSYSPTHCLTV